MKRPWYKKAGNGLKYNTNQQNQVICQLSLSTKGVINLLSENLKFHESMYCFQYAVDYQLLLKCFRDAFYFGIKNLSQLLSFEWCCSNKFEHLFTKGVSMSQSVRRCWKITPSILNRSLVTSPCVSFFFLVTNSNKHQQELHY